MAADEGAHKARRRRAIIVVSVVALAVVLLGLAAWFALSARSVGTRLAAGRDDLLAARASLSAPDRAAALDSVQAAAAHAADAATEVQGPIWDAAAALPWIGATVEAVRAVATSFHQAISALAPAVTAVGALDPDTLVASDGTLDLAALETATGPVEAASEGVATASRTLAAAPSRAAGDPVHTRVDEAASELASQLAQLADQLDGVLTVARIAPPLLGADGPRRYFVAVLNPNEARGTGGFLGAFAILRADRGRITVDRVGSNSELSTLPALPRDLGEQYLQRYGEDPRLVANMNISPHHPAAAELWLESWRLTTGETLDGAISADVVALGDLVSATGKAVPLPGGGSLTGEQLTSFAISGIYERFPRAADGAAREAFQEAVTAAAFEIVSGSANRAELASALRASLAERRIQAWFADDDAQAAVLDAGVGGSLRVPPGHSVAFAVINASGSKLDAYLTHSLVYEVGRCSTTPGGMVESLATARIISDIPAGLDVPEYMISQAERGPEGPVNSTFAQFHLPLGAQVLQVDLDGGAASYAPFTEQDRTSLVLPVDLPPRVERTVTVRFLEPASDAAGSSSAQPLVGRPDVTVLDRSCSAQAQ